MEDLGKLSVSKLPFISCRRSHKRVVGPYQDLFYINFAAGAGSDVFVAVVLTYFLVKSRTGGFNTYGLPLTMILDLTRLTLLMEAYRFNSRRFDLVYYQYR